MPPGMLPDMLRWKQSMSCFGSGRAWDLTSSKSQRSSQMRPLWHV